MQTLEQIAQILTEIAEVSSAETKRMFSKENEIRRLSAWYNACQEVTVRNGFPVLVWMEVCKPDYEVGYMEEWFSDAEISTKNYGSVRFLNLSEEEKCNAINQAFEAYLWSR